MLSGIGDLLLLAGGLPQLAFPGASAVVCAGRRGLPGVGAGAGDRAGRSAGRPAGRRAAPQRRPTCHWGRSSGRQACSSARSRTAEGRGSGAFGTSTGRTRSRPHATEPATARWRPRHRSVEERWSGRTAGRPLIGRGRRWTPSETGRTPARRSERDSPRKMHFKTCKITAESTTTPSQTQSKTEATDLVE